jgi:hypothetical protein
MRAVLEFQILRGTVEFFHLQMVLPPRPLPEDMKSTIEAELMACRSNDEAFMQIQSFREQCFNAYRILRMDHVPHNELLVRNSVRTRVAGWKFR